VAVKAPTSSDIQQACSALKYKHGVRYSIRVFPVSDSEYDEIVEAEITDRRIQTFHALGYVHGKDRVMIVPFPDGQVPTLEEANPQGDDDGTSI
jgi:hypothetical protein